MPFRRIVGGLARTFLSLPRGRCAVVLPTSFGECFGFLSANSMFRFEKNIYGKFWKMKERFLSISVIYRKYVERRIDLLKKIVYNNP